jgi:hypothetical protein
MWFGVIDSTRPFAVFPFSRELTFNVRAQPRRPSASAAAKCSAAVDSSAPPRNQRCCPDKVVDYGFLQYPTPHVCNETGDQEFCAPVQSAEAMGRSAPPRELTAARTSVQRSDAKMPVPSASTTACCSEAPRPMLPGIHEKKRKSRLAGIPGDEASSVLIIKIRSTFAATMDSLTVAMLAKSNAAQSNVVAVTPKAVCTASAPENASARAAPSARDSTTTTRKRRGTSVMRSGRSRKFAFLQSGHSRKYVTCRSAPAIRFGKRKKAPV